MTFPWKKEVSKLTDTELLQAVYDGREEAVVYLFYQKFSSTFQYHIYNIFPYKVDVAELVDELFLYLYQDDWRRLRTYDPSKAALSTWISMVSYRFFKQYKASRIDFNNVISISDRWETFRTDWVQSSDEGAKMDIAKAVDAIKSERDRGVAQMLFIEDRPYEEVAARYDMSVDYVYTVKNRILKQLKKELEAYG